MKYAFLGSIVLSTMLSMSFVGCGSDNNTNPNAETDKVKEALEKEAKIAIDASLVGVAENDKIPFGDGSFSPFSRVAIFPTVKGADGMIDYNATDAKVKDLAITFAKYVANTDEPKEDNTTFKGANWIVGGVESKTATATEIKPHIIQIPTKKRLNPNLAKSTKNTKKVQVVEVCNSTYAGKALGVKPIGGEILPKGIYHTTSLPCEVTFYNDDKAIYVDVLNPETIFTLFFTEVFSDPLMDVPAFREEMMNLPTQVKNEISAMVYNAFDKEAEKYSKSAIKMGPIFSSMSKALSIPKTVAPYKHISYKSTDGTAFTATNAKAIAQKIINVMTIHGNPNAGTQEATLFNALPSKTQTNPVNPLWRSARHEPLKVPGGSWIIEACSPAYAKEALSTGEFHTAALPCELAVFVSPEDDTNQTIDISILSADFMFNGLFSDAMQDMNASQKTYFGNIITNIQGDLEAMINYAMENNVSEFADFSTGVEITPITYQ